MKKSKKGKRKFNKKIIAAFGIILLLIIGFFVIAKFEKTGINGNAEKSKTADNTNKQVQIANSSSGNSGEGNNIATPVATQTQIYVLNDEKTNLLNQTVLSSEFIKDFPEKGIIALRFYDFIGEQRIWVKDILIGKHGLLNEGKPDLVLIMHAKYVAQLNETNLCDVIKTAKTNGEMWSESEKSDVELLFKYSGMIKYRNCFGF
jgi:hypothetical protein